MSQNRLEAKLDLDLDDLDQDQKQSTIYCVTVGYLGRL